MNIYEIASCHYVLITRKLNPKNRPSLPIDPKMTVLLGDRSLFERFLGWFFWLVAIDNEAADEMDPKIDGYEA